MWGHHTIYFKTGWSKKVSPGLSPLVMKYISMPVNILGKSCMSNKDISTFRYHIPFPLYTLYIYFMYIIYISLSCDTYFYFRKDKHATVFCYHCCKITPSNRLKTHCHKVHGTASRALCYGEKPVKPIYMNWDELTQHYLETDPIKNLSVRIIHPTKSILRKRLHPFDSDGDISPTRKNKSAIRGKSSSPKATKKRVDKANNKYPSKADQICQSSQTDIAIGKDEVKGISLNLLHMRNTAPMKK